MIKLKPPHSRDVIAVTEITGRYRTRATFYDNQGKEYYINSEMPRECKDWGFVELPDGTLIKPESYHSFQVVKTKYDKFPFQISFNLELASKQLKEMMFMTNSKQDFEDMKSCFHKLSFYKRANS